MLLAVAGVVGLWLVLPMLVVIPMSFTGIRSFQFPPPSWSTEWYSNFFTDPAWRDSLITSLEIALLTMLVATALGTAAAFALRRRFRGAAIVRALLLTPMIVPLVILAVGIYAVFLEWGLVGTHLGFVCAHAVLALPFPLITVSASLETLDPELDRAAAILGAGPVATFLKVTLPLIAPGVLTGALFAFAASFDEVIVSLFLATPTVRTLPVQMYSSITDDIDPTMAAASSVLLTMTLVMLALAVAARRLRRKRHA